MNPPEPVLMLDPRGSVVPVDPAKVEESTRVGFTSATPEQISDYQKQLKYGGSVGAAKAFGLGVLSGPTLGASDVALEKSGLVSKDTLEGLTEEHGLAHGAGEFVGLGAAALATGGLSAEGQAAFEAAEASGMRGPALAAFRATLEKSTTAKIASALPSNLVSTGGHAIEGAVAKSIGTEGAQTFGKALLRSAVSKGLGGAAEGATYQAAHEVSEAALGNPTDSAEAIAAHVGLGALFGGTLGATTGLASEAIPTYLQKAKDLTSDLYGKAKGALADSYTKEGAASAAALIHNPQAAASLEEAIPGVTRMLAKAKPEIQDAMLSNADELTQISQKFGPDAVGNMVNLDKQTFQKFVDNMDAIVTDPEARAKMQSDLIKAGKEVYASAEKLGKTLYGEIAPEEAAKLVANADPVKVGQVYSSFSDKLESAIAEMKDKPDLYANGYASTLKAMQEGLIRDASGNPVEDFQRMRTLRQQLGDLSSFETGPKNLQQKNAIQLVRGLRSAVRDALTDEEVFGPQAARQVALDDATHEMINAQKAFKQQFMIKLKGRDVYEVTPTKVNTWLNQMADPRGDFKSEAWGALMDAHKKMTDVAAESFKNAPVSDFDEDALKSLINKTGETEETARRAAATTQQWNLIQGRTGGWGSNPYVAGSGGIQQAVTDKAAGMVGAGIGGVLGGFPGAAIGAGIEKGVKAVANLKGDITKQVAALAAIEKAGQTVGKRLDSAVEAMVRGLDRASSIGRGEAAAGLSRWASKSDDEKQKIYEKQTALIQRLSNNPDALQAHVEGVTSGIASHAPDTATALAMHQANAVQFFASKIPSHPKAGLLSAAWKPASPELNKWERYWDAGHNPVGVIKKAANGTMMPEHLETLHALYPGLLGKAQMKLTTELGKHGSKTPYISRAGIGMILGSPPDGSYTPQSIQASQASYAPKAPTPKPAGEKAKALTLNTRMLTPQQSSAQRL